MRTRLLAVGQAALPSGYSRVMEGLLAQLAPDCDVALLAVDARERPPPRRSYPVYANPGGVHGEEMLPGVLAEEGPDVVLFNHDPALHAANRHTLDSYRARRPGVRVVTYTPASEWSAPQLAGADLAVLYTDAAREVVAEAALDPMPELAVVPHAIDVHRFRPLDRRAARRSLFPGRPELDDAFVVLNANRNIRRKRVDLTLRGFARFAAERPDAYLYLHMGARDLGPDVEALAADLGVAGRLLMTPHTGTRPEVSDERLNLVYNACDVGLSTASAEGWGLVPFEHGATGAAQVLPDLGAHAELWPGHALLVPAAAPGEDGSGLVDPDDVAAALARLYEDPAERARLGARARELANSPDLAWPAVGERWRELLLRHPVRSA
ncbi:MAG TPA: glycosyltransferase family 4 protein [Thermoleophilaceae bacterium]|jgi:glycosyltransferase involved in cell wall biosynthesis